MRKYPYWVVVADGSRARIFERNKFNEPLRQIEMLENPASRQKTSDLVCDKPGHATRGDTLALPSELEEDRFANRLAQQLGLAAHNGQFSDLVLVAAPRFLGQLRAGLPAPARAKLSVEMAKNLTAKSPVEIQQYLESAEAS